MNKVNCIVVGVFVITLVMSTAGPLVSSMTENKKSEICVKNPCSMGPILEVTTDKLVYNMGQLVTIFLTNVGDETLSGGGPIITIYNAQEEIVYQEATNCWYELEPGEYIEWLPWDQTNQQGQQVSTGKYVAEGFLSGDEENYVDDAIFFISKIGDELDQYQTNYDEYCTAPIGYFPYNTTWNVSIAQSFTPTKEILTRVELYVGKNVTAYIPYVLAIRDNLTGENLTLASVNPDEFMVFPNISWIEFDFDDILISIGETYYVVSYTSKVKDNTYIWGANCSDVYLNGTPYASFDGGETWEIYLDADACFMTYGRDNQPPTTPNIKGQTRGKTGKEYEYTITGLDPDGDELYVIIYWGDNTSSELLGPYDGSYEITMKHAWDEGTYTIKVAARDFFGWGPEGTLEVTMPKNKPPIFNFPLLSWLFERFPNAFPILRYIIVQ